MIAGGGQSDDIVARWAYAVRSSSGPLPIALYHRGERRARTNGTHVLPDSPGDAQQELSMLLQERRTAVPTGPLRESLPQVTPLHRSVRAS